MGRASEATSGFYRYGGELLLKASARHAGIDPALAPPDILLSALSAHLLPMDTTLAAGTVCVYRQQLASAIEGLVNAGANVQLAQITKSSLLQSLLNRQGTPLPARGASLKIELPEKQELAEVFYLLKKRFLDALQNQDLILCLYILLNPRLGLRPVEITRAHREGRMLVVMSAKRRGRYERKIPLKAWPEDFLFAIDVLLSLVPRDLDAHAFKLWRNALASKLARASMHTYKNRRLALYCCRHIAFATWREIGMSPQQIMELAGHAGLTAQNVYGRSGKGFGARWLFHDLSQTTDSRHTAFPGSSNAPTLPRTAKDGPHVQNGTKTVDPVSSKDAGSSACDTGTAHSNQEHKTEPAFVTYPGDDEPVAATGFAVEDMPTATPRRTHSPPALSPAEVRKRFERLVDPRPLEDIVASLRQARLQTGEHPAPKPGDSDEPAD